MRHPPAPRIQRRGLGRGGPDQPPEPSQPAGNQCITPGLACTLFSQAAPNLPKQSISRGLGVKSLAIGTLAVYVLLDGIDSTLLK
jgi:hypothetical protein